MLGTMYYAVEKESETLTPEMDGLRVKRRAASGGRWGVATNDGIGLVVTVSPPP